MESSLLRVGMWQARIPANDPWGALRLLRQDLDAAAPHDLLILPETSLTGFVLSPGACDLPHDIVQDIALLARERQSWIVLGLGSDKRNVMRLLDPCGEVRGEVAKRHLFGPGGEPEVFQAGASTPDWAIGPWRIRATICYELRFSPLFWHAADQVDLYVVAANWPQARRDHWTTLLAARAIENQAFVVGVNRLGNDALASYAGDSRMIDPRGRTILDAADLPGIHVIEIDRQEVGRVRDRFPVLRDRIIEVAIPAT